MPNVVILTSYPFPGFSATSNRVISLARALSKYNLFQVSVIGPGPDKSMESFSIDNEEFSLVNVNYNLYKGKNLFIRALKEIRFTFQLLKKTIHSKPDILIATIPSIFLLVAVLLKKQHTPSVIIDVRDLVWEYFLKKSNVYKIVGKIMKYFCLFALRQADHVSLTNKEECKKISKIIKSPLIVHNGLDRKRFDQLKALSINKLNKTNELIFITYAGNIGIAQKLHTLIDATKNLENVKVTLIGNGKDFVRIQRYIDKNQINNVVMTGELNWVKILNYYKNTEIFFVQIGKEFTTALPSKIFECLASGKPLILAAPNGPATELSTIFEGLHVVEPEDPVMLKDKITSIISSKNVTYPNNIKIIEDNYLREDQALKFSEMVEEVYFNSKSNITHQHIHK